jgi:hypothetical protein
MILAFTKSPARRLATVGLVAALFSGCATPTVTPSPAPSALPTLRPTTPSPSPTEAPTATPEITAAPEKIPPAIAGLHESVDASGSGTYLADGTNPYGFKENSVAGYFNPNVKTENPDGTTTNGAVDLDAKVVLKLGVDGSHVPLPVDVGKDAKVDITFDSNGWHNPKTITSYSNGWHGTPRVYLAFPGQTLAVSSTFTTNTKCEFMLPSDDNKTWTWIFGSVSNMQDPTLPLTDQTALDDTLVYGQGDSMYMDSVYNTFPSKALSFGATYAHVRNSLSVSITNSEDSREISLLKVGVFPVSVKSAA